MSISTLCTYRLHTSITVISIETFRTQVQISELAPGTIITPHCGNTNLRLRIHLPIRVPCVSCAGLHVQGAQIVHLNEGEAFAFDDSYEHEAWHNVSNELNPTNLSRIVLIVDIWHPDVDNELIEKLLLV